MFNEPASFPIFSVSVNLGRRCAYCPGYWNPPDVTAHCDAPVLLRTNPYDVSIRNQILAPAQKEATPVRDPLAHYKWHSHHTR